MKWPSVNINKLFLLRVAENRNLTDLFSSQVEKARNDELRHWENDPKATLALIILQDQFLRSLYKVCDKYRVNDRLANQTNKVSTKRIKESV